MISITKMSSKTMGSYIEFSPRNTTGNLLKAFRKYTINVRNTDDQKCSIYCIILSKFGKEIQGDLTLPTHLKPFMDFVDDTDVEYPVSEKDLLCLERNNSRSLNIAINVWRYVSSERIDPYYISKVRTKGKTECNMLLIEEAKAASLLKLLLFVVIGLALLEIKNEIKISSNYILFEFEKKIQLFVYNQHHCVGRTLRTYFHLSRPNLK